MGHVQKKIRKNKGRATTTWVARYVAPDRRERSKSFLRKADADAFLASVESEKLHHSWIDPAKGRTPYDVWLQTWRVSRANLRPSTRARDDSYIRNHILPRFGPLPLLDISRDEINDWIASLSQAGLAPATVCKTYELLAASLDAAVESEYIPRSPCRKISLPRIETREMRFLTVEEVLALAGAIEPRYRPLVLVGAYGALRIGELAALRLPHINMLKGEIRVVDTLSEASGRVYFGPPKTKAGRRTIPGIPRAVMEELAEHLRRFPGTDDLVFTAPQGGPLRPTNFRPRFFDPAVGRTGLEGVTPHTLRHTGISLWSAAGATLKQASVWAGHRSTSFTQDRYGHLFPESAEPVRQRLEAMHRYGSVTPPDARQYPT